MKRLISLVLIMCLAVGISVPVFADDGKGFVYSTDFEEYSDGQGKGPDESWYSTFEQYPDKTAKPNFSPYTEPDGNTCMKLDFRSEPTLWFGQMMTSGRMHMSVYVKTMGNEFRLLGHSSESSGDGKQVISTYESDCSKYIRLYDDGKVQYFQTPKSWTKIDTDVTFNPNEWTRVDIITSEMSETTVTADYYVNETKINTEPVQISEAQGIKALIFKYEANPGSNPYIYIDNVYVERFFGNKGLTGIISSKVVSAENAQFTVKLSDTVDKELLTVENITIKNVVTNQVINNFEITDATDSGFKVTIGETLEKGNRYSLILSSTIKGSLHKSSMTVPISFMTENRIEELTEVAVELDFNSFDSADGISLPSGFVNLEGVEFSNSKVLGKTGETDDYAWSVTSSNEDIVRFMYETDALPKGAEYKISFDVYSNDANWVLFLAEPGDFDTNNTRYDKNIALTNKRIQQRLMYAEERTNDIGETTQISTSLKAGHNAWHNVKLKITPTANGSDYTVSVDGGSEYTVSTQRSFLNGLKGFGFGYISGDEGTLIFDNVSFGWKAEVAYPEVKEVTLVDVYGNEITDTEKISSMISSIYVDFSTTVDMQSAKEKCALIENNSPFEIDFGEMTENGTRFEVKLPKLLNANSDYEFCVAEGVVSLFSEKIKSSIPISIEFNTRNDAGFKLLNKTFNDDKTAYTVTFAKNNNAEINIFAAAGSYSQFPAEENGETRVFEKMTDFTYIPIQVEQNDKGVIEYNIPVLGDADKTRLSLWRWPKLTELTMDESGNILP